MILLSMEGHRGKLAYFAGMKVRFRRPVFPGDTFICEVEVIKHRGSFGWVSGVGRVDGEVAVEGELSYSAGPRRAAGLSRRGSGCGREVRLWRECWHRAML